MAEMTTAEVAERLSITQRAVLLLIQRGVLEASLVGPAKRGVWIITQASLDAEIERRLSPRTGRGRPPGRPTANIP